MSHFRFMRERLKSKGLLFPENSLADSKNEHSSSQTRTRMDMISFSRYVPGFTCGLILCFVLFLID